MRTPRTAEADPKAASVIATKKSAGRAGKLIKRTPEIEIALGARIRAARVAAKMSQTALGATLGISFQQVQKYEKGKDRIAASTLQGFAAVLGVHPGSFYGDAMPAPSGSVPNVKAAMRAAEILQQIHDPRVLKQFLVLARLLAKPEVAVEQSATPGDKAP